MKNKYEQEAARLRGLYDQVTSQARSLMNEWEGKSDEMPDEVKQDVNQLLGKADEYAGLIDMNETIAGQEAYMKEPSGPPQSAKHNWRPAGPDEGDQDIDPKAWRSFEMKRLRRDPIHGTIHEDVIEVRYHVPLVVQQKGYKSAFESYLRNGKRRMGPNDRKTLTEGLDDAGGFLVPEDYQAELIKKIAAQATIRARARVATTSRDIATWPKVNYDSDDKYTSPVRMKWTGESPSSSTVHRVNEPVFGVHSIPIHTAMASFPLSNNLIEDSAFDVVGISSDLLSEAFVLGENEAFINGNGTGRPMGILTQVDGDGPASVVSGTTSTLTADGIIDLDYELPPQYENNAVHIMNKATEKVIRKLKDANNNYIWPIWPQMGGFAAAPRELLGYPVMRDQFMPDVSAGAYPIIFGDLRGYLVLDRVGISIQRLTELYAEDNVTLLLARKRLGGKVIEPWRMKVQKVGT